MFCSNCGKKVSDDARFCPYCGARVLDDDDDNPNVNSNDNLNVSDNSSASDSSSAAVNAAENPGDIWDYDNIGNADSIASGNTENSNVGNSSNGNSYYASGNAGNNNAGNGYSGYYNTANSSASNTSGEETTKSWTSYGDPRTYDNGVQQASNKSYENEPLDKGRVAMVIAAAIAVLALVIGVSVYNANTINLNDYITVDISGYDHYGKATYNFDQDAFENKWGEKLVDNCYDRKSELFNLIGEDTYSEVVTDFFSDYVKGSLSSDSELSNGDNVTFSWDCDDDKIYQTFGVRVRHSDVNKHITGLEEIESFDPFEGVDVSFSGIDSYGQVILTTLDDSVGNGVIQYTYSPSDHLKNGDVVTVSIEDLTDSDIESIGMIPSSTEKEYTVSDLPEAESFDPFDGVNVCFTGVEPEGKLELNDLTGGEYDSLFSYTASAQDALSNGDEVTITIEPKGSDLMSDCTAALGAVPTVTEKTYTVEGLSKYVSSISEIPEDTLSGMKKSIEDSMTAEIAQENAANARSTYYTVKPHTDMSMKYCGAYVLSPKLVNGQYTVTGNMVKLVYKIEVSVSNMGGSSECGTGTYYYPVTYNDVLIDGNGDVSIDNNNISSPNKQYKVYSDPGESAGYVASFDGYDSIDSMYNDEITSVIDDYNCSGDLDQ